MVGVGLGGAAGRAAGARPGGAGGDTVAILLYDEESQQLAARAAKGIEEEVEQGVRIPIGKGFAGRIAAERVAIFVADVDHADILNPILREKGSARCSAYP